MAADSLPVRLLVGLKPGFDAKAGMSTLDKLGLRGAEANGQKRNGLLAELGVKSLSVPKSRVSSVLAALRQDSSVAYVEVDQKRHTSAVTPNDPVYTGGLQKELGRIKVPTAWQTTTGSDVTVAVIDTGVAAVGDLAGKVLPNGYDYVNGDNDPTDDAEFPHGTVVSSLIAANTDNGAGMAGVCWQCKILPIKVLDATGSGWDTDIAQGILYAARNGASIINLSLGGPGYSKVLAGAVAYANAKGVLVVAAAGNDGSSIKSYPAAFPDVLAVGGTDTSKPGDSRVWFSNYGSWVDVSAPAITVGMFSDGSYQTDLQGTSFATPLVVGTAALVKSAHPEYSGWSLGSAIVRSATPAVKKWNNYGLIDAAKALTFGTDTTPPTVARALPAQNTAVRGTVTITPYGLKDAGSGVRLVELYVNGAFHSWSYTGPAFAPKLNTAAFSGPISLRLKVTDKAGNVTWSGYRNLIVDNAKPVFAVTSWPKDKAKVKGTITIKANATDAISGVSKVVVLVNGKVVATDTRASWVLAVNSAKQPKTMKVQVRAYDKAGNYAYSATRTYTHS
ncbi:S8 family serine peptidase [Actinoplanes regularis]|uniref:S8 family serine peptidase n=1 Tax=Actinoplanes regularis TaxID=52697 RepID=UPI0015C65AC0|nr:S8 family serine peptidase [Actinoplanes regularis]